MARQAAGPSHVVIPLWMIVKLGKYISGVAFLAYGCQYFALHADSVHHESGSSAQWFSLARRLGSEVIFGSEEQQDALHLDSAAARALASNAFAGSASHGSSANTTSATHLAQAGHSSSGCWAEGKTPHKLAETFAMCLFCFLTCSMIDHLNLLINPAWRFPISVLMFSFGMLIGVFFIYRSGDLFGMGFDILADGMKDTTFFDPHALLYIVLPPLLYESASSMSWHVLRKILPSAILLAVPGVVLNTLFTGMYVKLVVRMETQHGHDGHEVVPSWPTALLLATILSATDPVAVVAALSALGAPAKLSSLVEGESLLNDGSAVVLCWVFLDWVAVGEPSDVKLNPYCEGDPNGACVTQFFCHMALGGVAIGIIASFLLQTWISYAHLRHDPRLELSIVTVFVYGTFFVAEAMKMSGVLAEVVLGFGMAISINKSLSHEARHNHHVLYSYIGYVCNQITFFSAGIISARFMLGDTYCSHTFWAGARPIAELIGLYVWIHLGRGAVVLLFFPLLRRMGYGMTWKEGVVLVFGGLRGAVGLIMGLIVEHNHYVDPQVAQMVAFHTAGIVLLTLFVNGQFIDTLYTKLDLYPQNPYRQQHLRKILDKVEAESQKIGIKVIANDWFFSDCLFPKLFQCVPNFGFIEFDEAKQPVPIGIDHVDHALSGLFPYASNFRKAQLIKMANEGEDTESKWMQRRDVGDMVFLEMMDSKSEVTSKHDHLVRVKPQLDKLLYSKDPSYKSGQDGGLYVSGFSLEALKKEDDESFGFEVEICELQGLHLIVGLFANLNQVREPEYESSQILGTQENSIGFDCLNNKVATNGPARDDVIETECKQLRKGDVLSVAVTRRPFGEWEIEFGLPNDGIVVKRITLGPFSPCELYPAIEFRPIVSLSSAGSGLGSSKSLGGAAFLSSGAEAVGSSLRSLQSGATVLASVVGASIKGVTGNSKKIGEANEDGDEPGTQGRVSLPGANPESLDRQVSTASARGSVDVYCKVGLSFEIKPASDQDSLVETFHVFFNMLLNQYTSMHESGTICDSALVFLRNSVHQAMDNAHNEVNCKNAREFMGNGTSSGVMRAFSTGSRTVSGFGIGKPRTSSCHGLGIETLYEPVLLEYLVLRHYTSKPGFFDRFEGQRLRALGYHNTRAKVEALWAFIEAHNKVVEESPSMERFPQFVECVATVVKEAVQDLVCLRDVQPFRFFYCKHLLALRMIFNRRLNKLKKFIHDGLLSHGDGQALEEVLLERINEVNLWNPRLLRPPKSGADVPERPNSDAWQHVDLKPKMKKSLSSLTADDFRLPPPIVKRMTAQFSHKSKISEKSSEDDGEEKYDSAPTGPRSLGDAGALSPEPPPPLTAYNDSIPAPNADFNDSIPADGQVDDQSSADQIAAPVGEPTAFAFKAVERSPSSPANADAKAVEIIALPPLVAPARGSSQGWTPESISPRASLLDPLPSITSGAPN